MPARRLPSLRFELLEDRLTPAGDLDPTFGVGGQAVLPFGTGGGGPTASGVVTLPTGEVRKFLEDGDEVTLRGYCERDGLPRIGLGTCSGRVSP